ncbi:MAG: beta strand repeat-containing protein, partial [Gemmatimonadales bacterium]
PSVQLQDLNGNDVALIGRQITATVSTGGTLTSATATTDAAGLAQFVGLTLSGPIGSYTLTFASTGLTSVNSAPIALGAGPAAKLALITQPSSAAVSGVAFGQQPVVQVQDAAGNPVDTAGIRVSAALASGGPVLAGTDTIVTDAAGKATFTDLNIAGASGQRTLNFTAPGLTGVVSNAVNVGAGAATHLVLSTAPPAAAQSGTVMIPQPVIQLQDASDNNVAQANVNIQVAVSGTASLSGATTVATDPNGTATYVGLAIVGAAGSYTLDFSAPGTTLTGVTSGPISLTAGTGSRLAIVTQPSASARSGVAFSVQPSVQLQDNVGNLVKRAGDTVKVAVGSGPGGGTLSNAMAITDTSGLATFAGLTLSGTAANYTLSFGATGFSSVASNAIALSPGLAAKLALVTQPSAVARSGLVLPQQPVVQVQDGAGNPVDTVGVSITSAIATGSGGLTGTNPITSTSGGVAAFADLVITGAVGGHTLSFTAPGTTGVTSAPLMLEAGLAAQLAIQAGDNQSATAGTAVSVLPSAKVTDGSGNPVAGVDVTFAVDSGGGAAVPTTPVPTDTAGLATVTSWTLGPVVGRNTLVATATGLAGSPLTYHATAMVGAATAITKSSGDSLTGPVLSTLGTPHDVLVTDLNGNPVPGVIVQWATVAGGTVSPSIDTTDLFGHSTAVRTLGASPGTQFTLATATLLGVPTSVTFSITATSGGASQMGACSPQSGDNQTDTVGKTLPLPLCVRVADQGNNPSPGVTVSWTTPNGSITATSVTDFNGVATASWTLGTTAGTQTAQATAAGAPVNFIANAVPGAVSASQSTLGASPGTIPASSGSSPSTLTVTARDQYG